MAHFRLPAAALAALGLSLGVALGGAPALAGAPAGLQLAQAGQFSDEQIRSFALAALEVQEIRTEYVARIQQAGSDDERQQLAEEASAEMVGAVQDTPGITVEDYNAIVQASSDNPELTERINREMQSATQ